MGCKTVWSEVLLYIKEDPHGSFYIEFHISDASLMHVCNIIHDVIEVT